MQVGVLTHLALCVAGDADWLAFSALAGATYTIATLNLVPGVDTIVRVVDASGTILAVNGTEAASASFLGS